jgi:hypothetical protein
MGAGVNVSKLLENLSADLKKIARSLKNVLKNEIYRQK